MKKISIQGHRGSFHDMVARDIFGSNSQILEKSSFEEVFEDVKSGKSDYGVVAIENSIAGSILENYDLLERYDLPIIGEYYLRIKHNLLALPGQSTSDIQEVHSHPMALKQCYPFLKKIQVKLVESEDTAASAREIKEKKLTGVAAIAGDLAARLYGLEVLAAGIETDKQNYTRFLVISKTKKRIKEANKSSIVVEVEHKPGSLAKVINCFAENNVNLTKIESRPIIGQPWEYRFYIDFELDAYGKKGTQVLDKVRSNSTHLKVLGSYRTFNANFQDQEL